MIDTRQGIRKFANIEGAENRLERLIRFAVSLIIALLAACLPEYEGVGSEGGSTLFILIFAAGLSASLAMALPVSTPPNAIVFASGALKSRDFWMMGIVSGVIGPLVILGWIYLVSMLF